jgi:EAL domain-containing protein (putative c-di-GMP-specific phosphodiesterase class I)
LAQWQLTNPSMAVAVNLSVRQIVSPGIVDMVADALARSGVHPGSVCLEVTESVFMNDADYFGETLLRLRALGVRLSIDDFGTGYSSLSYLKRFPVDAVKVDKAFIDGLGADPHDPALVAAIVAMADALGLVVTAEGVESPEQLRILRRLQCQRGQGYFLPSPCRRPRWTGWSSNRTAGWSTSASRYHRWRANSPDRLADVDNRVPKSGERVVGERAVHIPRPALASPAVGNHRHHHDPAL